MSSESTSSSGANKGDSFLADIKKAFGATEDLRKNINDFFDETIQPSAKKAEDSGVTANHAQHSGSSAQENSENKSSGFSKDAETLGDAIKK